VQPAAAQRAGRRAAGAGGRLPLPHPAAGDGTAAGDRAQLAGRAVLPLSAAADAPGAGMTLAARDLAAPLGDHPALHGAGLTLEKGRITAICGPNGAGKSTLLACLAGLLA